MNEEELLAKIAQLKSEYRSIADEYNDASKDAKDIEARLSAKNEEIRKTSKELAQLQAPADPAKTEERKLFDAEEFRKLGRGEVRSISIGTNAGATKDYAGIFEELVQNDNLLNKAELLFGKDALTRIPVIDGLGDLTSSTEATTSVTVDTDAGLTITSLEPKKFPRCLPVTAEAMAMGLVDLESKIQGIFDKAFRKALHKGMLVGAGTDGDAMTGIFTQVNSDISAATTATEYPDRVFGGVTIAKLDSLGVAVSGLDEEYTIIMSPSVYAALLADTATDETTKIVKETLIRDKMVENVKVVVDAYAPVNAATAKKAMVVAVPLSRYKIGVAAQMNIDTIKVKGDSNTYFQACPFFDGKIVDNRDLYALANNPS